jgi:dTDP-4-dehydrorhamnose reductase
VRVIILGATGQLGQALCQAVRLRGTMQLMAWGRPEYDIAVPQIGEQIVAAAPDLVINAAAYTHVDGAESEPDAAFAANMLGPKYIAEGCDRCGAAMVQVSTNEVFAGETGCFYREYDMASPKSIYARSKWAGETAAQEALKRLTLVRVAWLYGRGIGDFPAKILAAAGKREMLQVVADEFGNPTYAPHAAEAILSLAENSRHGNYHIVNEGFASRFEWTQALFARLKVGTRLEPISADAWKRPAPTPRHAVLVNQAAACFGVRLPGWQEALDEYIATNVLQVES